MRHKVISTAFKYSQVLMLLLIILLLSFTSSRFLTFDNFSNIIMQQAPFLLIISMGMTMAILIKGIDLSLGSNMALSSCVGAMFIKQGQILPGIVIALLVGAAIGLVNGLLITKARLAPFIATYTMDMVVRGIVYLLMGGTLIYGFEQRFRVLATGNALGISNMLTISLSLFAVLLFFLKATTFGRNLYSAGLNREATALSGINTHRIIIIVFLVNGLLAACTGLLYVARLDAAESTLGSDFTIKMMAAALIGGTQFSGGKGGIERTFIGVLIMMFLSNGMNINGISSLLQDAVFGAVIIVSLIIDKLGRMYAAMSMEKREAGNSHVLEVIHDRLNEDKSSQQIVR